MTHRDIPRIVWNGSDTVALCIQKQLLTSKRVTQSQYTRIISSLEVEYPALLRVVPSAGTSVQVVMKASIDFGTIYTYMLGDLVNSLQDIDTPSEWLPLEYTINEILWPLYGKLDVWRFDLKADGLEGLHAGKVQIIEINAWWAIPTHVYSPWIPMKIRIAEVSAHFDRIIDLVEDRKRTKDIALWVRDRIAFYTAVRRSTKKKWVPLSEILLELTPILKLYAKSVKMKYEKFVGDIVG